MKNNRLVILNLLIPSRNWELPCLDGLVELYTYFPHYKHLIEWDTLPYDILGEFLIKVCVDDTEIKQIPINNLASELFPEIVKRNPGIKKYIDWSALDAWDIVEILSVDDGCSEYVDFTRLTPLDKITLISINPSFKKYISEDELYQWQYHLLKINK